MYTADHTRFVPSARRRSHSKRLLTCYGIAISAQQSMRWWVGVWNDAATKSGGSFVLFFIPALFTVPYGVHQTSLCRTINFALRPATTRSFIRKFDMYVHRYIYRLTPHSFACPGRIPLTVLTLTSVSFSDRWGRWRRRRDSEGWDQR